MIAVENAMATIRSSAGGCALVMSMEGKARSGRKSLTALLAAPFDDSLQEAYVDSDHGGVLIFTAGVRGDTIRFV